MAKHEPWYKPRDEDGDEDLINWLGGRKARAAVERARSAQQAVNELVAPTTDGGNRETAVEAGTEGPSRLDAGQVSAVPEGIPTAEPGAGVPLPEAPAPAPFTTGEYDAIVHAIFDGLDSDPWRVGDLLADALGFIGGLAVRTDHHVAERAAGLLRRMEQRALWGRDPERPAVRIVHAELP